jgi:hypothetical protein
MMRSRFSRTNLIPDGPRAPGCGYAALATAIAVYDEVIERFGAASERDLRHIVAQTLRNKASALADLGRSEEAIAVCDDVVKHFGAANDPIWAVIVAKVTSLKESLLRS